LEPLEISAATYPKSPTGSEIAVIQGSGQETDPRPTTITDPEEHRPAGIAPEEETNSSETPDPDNTTEDGEAPDNEDEVPGLIDEDEDDDLDRDSKNEFKVKLEGTMLNEEQKARLQALLDRFPGIFAKNSKDLGKTDLMHHYTRVTTEKPVHAPMYKTPPPEVRKDIDRETDKLLASGVVCESQSAYSAPIVLVKKKCGG
jgi:hypothetical protein